MTTERNIKRVIRASKILAYLYGVLGVWMIVVSAIIINTFERDGLTKGSAYIGLSMGILKLINGSCFVYVALKCSGMESNVAVKRIRTMITCTQWMSIGFYCTEFLPVCFVAPGLGSRSTYKSDFKGLRKFLSINLIIVCILAYIVTLSVCFLVFRYAKCFTTATFSASREQPFERQQQHADCCSRGNDPPLSTAFKISREQPLDQRPFEQQQQHTDCCSRGNDPPSSAFKISLDGNVNYSMTPKMLLKTDSCYDLKPKSYSGNRVSS